MESSKIKKIQCPGDISSAKFKTLRPFLFSTPGGMEKDLESYDLTMPNKYNQCDYEFSHEGDLSKHVKRNTGQKEMQPV